MAKKLPERSRQRTGLFSRLYGSFFYLGLLYPLVIALLASPTVQKHATFKHAWRFPYYVKYDMPEKYGLAPGKTLNLNLTTPDNCTLGAWFVLADPCYQTLRATSPSQLSPLTESTVLDSIKTHPTVLFLHGAGGTRAASFRVEDYRAFSARLHANVFAIDYRGFGDSTGSPSESGLALDAYTAWQWLMARGAQPADVVIAGESLGTGVAGQLARRLAHEGVRPRGIALLAPFSSVARLLESYHLFGVPLLQPLQSFPWGLRLLKRIVHVEFDTLAAVPEFNAPTLIAHAQDDLEIPHAHSRTLVDALLAPLLPALTVAVPTAPGKTLSTEEFLALETQREARAARRGEVVRTTHVPNFGVVEAFRGLRAPVVYVETFWGSHAEVGAQEGVQDEMAKLFGLGVYRQEREDESVVDRMLRRVVE
ncbi:alpha/beta-hydrolase [Phanerochaete sordida]|uniref:Alpha/beta-hydrolase n=1 Tax=Phanerochaete sordida TaxID=48140 RepID=A0A9P3LEV7_9APHY|nr:alpha/beta-hydrolase [Phanerochaete sordida]